MNSIESQFVPYSAAVKLKKLGFYEDCLAYWHPNEYLVFRANVVWDLPEAPDAPLWQQATDWFRIEHDMWYNIHRFKKGNEGYVYWFSIKPNINQLYSSSPEWDTYESARLACLEKLIELVTEKNK